MRRKVEMYYDAKVAGAIFAIIVGAVLLVYWFSPVDPIIPS